jgi:hypothetical protein
VFYMSAPRVIFMKSGGADILDTNLSLKELCDENSKLELSVIKIINPWLGKIQSWLESLDSDSDEDPDSEIFGDHVRLLGGLFRGLTGVPNDLNDDCVDLVAAYLSTDPDVLDTLEFYKVTNGSGIGDYGTHAVSLALQRNTHVTNLNLMNNNIGRQGAVALATMLKTNSTITDINLRSNNIGDDGALEIALGLVQNKTLEELYLDENNITDRGCISLAESLCTNKTLKVLHLRSNAIGLIGIEAFAKALEVNTDVIVQIIFPQAKLHNAKKHPNIDIFTVHDLVRLRLPPRKGKLNIQLTLPKIH